MIIQYVYLPKLRKMAKIPSKRINLTDQIKYNICDKLRLWFKMVTMFV